jgi:glycosyl transferase family 25
MNELVDACFVLNLDRRPERMKCVSTQLKEAGIAFERVSAVDGQDPNVIREFDNVEKKKGASFHFGKNHKRVCRYACYKSHMLMWKTALDRGYQSVAIFEDDIHLHKNFNAKLKTYLKHLPTTEWNMLLLGVNQKRAVDQNTQKSYPYWVTPYCHTFGGFAYVMRRPALEWCYKRAQEICRVQDVHIMVPYYTQHVGKCFVAQPHLVIVNVSDSDLRNKSDQQHFAKVRNWTLQNYYGF